MRDFVSIAAFILLIFIFANDSNAHVIRFCGGPKGLSYEKFPNILKPIIDGFKLDFTLKLVETKGGDENIDKVTKGECDFGLAPNKLARKHKLLIDGVVFNSYAHLVCNQERTNGAKEISDLLKQGRKIHVAIGDIGSASKIVWESLIDLDDDLGETNFTTIPVGFSDAIQLVINGQYDCAWTVSDIGSPALKAIDYPALSKVLNLVAVNDGDFNNGNFNDEDYDFFVIPKSTYPNLQSGRVRDVKTIGVPVVLFHRKEIQSQNPVAYGIVSGEALRVGTGIFK